MTGGGELGLSTTAREKTHPTYILKGLPPTVGLGEEGDDQLKG